MARSYSKRSRQPSANAARANDPAHQPNTAILEVVDAAWSDASTVKLTFDRQVTVVQRNAGPNSWAILLVNDSGSLSYRSFAIVQISATEIELTIQGDPMGNADTAYIAADHGTPQSTYTEEQIGNLAEIRGLDNGIVPLTGTTYNE